MARLEGTHLGEGRAFGLSPVAQADLVGDAMDYQIEVAAGAGSPRRTVHTIAGWQMGPDPIWAMARALAQVHQMANVIIPLDIWGVGRGEHPSLFLQTDWLHLVVTLYQRQCRANLDIYVQARGRASGFDHMFLQADPGAVAAFGGQLEQEVVSASPEWWASRGQR
jgi:hypothetical protein